MTVAKVTEITATSTKSFQDALASGIERANKTLKNISGAWLADQEVVVEDGKITAPTKDFTIEGNGPDMLRNITMAASDSRMDAGGWLCGKNGQTVPVSQGMPTVLVSSLKVS